MASSVVTRVSEDCTSVFTVEFFDHVDGYETLVSTDRITSRCNPDDQDRHSQPLLDLRDSRALENRRVNKKRVNQTQFSHKK